LVELWGSQDFRISEFLHNPDSLDSGVGWLVAVVAVDWQESLVDLAE
jgi:hypothetical protein